MKNSHFEKELHLTIDELNAAVDKVKQKAHITD